jgi:hypothetical protein
LPPGNTGTAFTTGANLAASASGGSLATTTGAFKITWITANGESLPSAEATVSVTGATGSVTVSLGSVGSTNTGTQALAAPIIGWKPYSGSGAGNELANEVAASLSVALATLILPNGNTLTYIPIATTSVVVKVYGNGAAPPTLNTSGIQQPLPNIAANNSADQFAVVRRSFRPQKEVNWIRPNSAADAGGLLVSLMDCVAPLWPVSTAVTAGVTPNYIVVNSTVFICSVGGATWTSLGEAALVRIRWSNTTGSAGQPTSQEYDLFQA